MALINHGDGTAYSDPVQLFRWALIKLYTKWVKATYPFVSMGEKVCFHYTCDARNPHLIKIGNSVMIGRDVLLHPLGFVPSNVVKEGEPLIVIGDGCRIERRCHIGARNLVHLERNVIVAASALIIDHSHMFEDTTRSIKEQGVNEGGQVRIGEGTWIGQGAVIICDKGELTIGRNCIVGANAVVTRSCPPYSVISGNPARIVKQFDPARGAWELGGSRAAETGSVKEPDRAPHLVQS